MVVVAMMAMMLMAAAPAFAQAGDAVATDGSIATGGDQTIEVLLAPQVQLAFAAQGQFGDANATGDASSAEIGQSLVIEQHQVNGGF